MSLPAFAADYSESVAPVNGVITVSTAADLTAALADTTVDTIKLGADIDLGTNCLTINKALTITSDGDGDAKTITSSAAQAILLTGSGNVTLEKVNVTATKGHGIQAGDDNTAYSGQLTVKDSTVTTLKRGVRVYGIASGFEIELDHAIIQNAIASDYATGYNPDSNDSLGLSLAADIGYGVNILNGSEIRGYAYCINGVSSGSNINVTMNGGKLYGRAGVNFWGANNHITLTDVEIHGLNNQTGSTEAFSCIVDNSPAEGNTYTFNNCAFIARLSSAAANTATSSATEQMIDLRGKNSAVYINGRTTYTAYVDDGEVDTYSAVYAKRFGLVAYPFVRLIASKGNRVILANATYEALQATIPAHVSAEDVTDGKRLVLEEIAAYACNFADGRLSIVGYVYPSSCMTDIKSALANQEVNSLYLLGDIEVSEMLSVTSDLCVFINGYKLAKNNGSSLFSVTNDAALTLTDNEYSNSRVYGRINVGKATNGNGKVYIYGGTYTCADNQTVLHVNGTCLESVVEIYGATIVSPTDNGIQLNGAGTFAIADSSITGATGVYIKSGTTQVDPANVSISGSTIIGTGEEAGYTYNGNGSNPTGDALVIDNCGYPGGAPTVEITDGKFKSAHGQPIGSYAYGKDDNGNDRIPVEPTYPEGKTLRGPDSEGFWTVRAKYDATITRGEAAPVGYSSLEDAFAAAVDGDTITLLQDCAGNGIKAPQGKFNTNGLTVDFAGHTYTVDGDTVGSTGTETNGFQLLKENTITFKNGTITSTKAKILVQNYSNLTLEGMTLTLDNPNYASAYTLSNNNGNIVIDGSTINANPAGGFAFDVCRYASYPSVNVEVKGSSVINGNVEVYASGSDAKEGFSLTLTSGTMTGDIVMDASATAAMETTPEKVSVTKADDFEQDAPDGYKWADNGNGTSSLAEATYVAQVGETKYETLAAAIEAAQEGDTITLLADINVTAQVEVGKELTLDLAGHKIEYTGTATLSSGVIQVLRGGDLTVTDSSGNNTGKIKSGDKAYAAIALTKAGETSTADAILTVNGGTLEGYYYGITGNGSRHGTVITINGGTIRGTCAVDNLGIYHPQDGTLTIKGGTISGYSSAVELRSGTLNVTGGTLEATATSYSCNPNGSGTTTVGAALAIAQHTTNKAISASITGGTFNASGNAVKISVSNPQNNAFDNVTVTSSVTDSTKIPTDYTWSPNGDGTSSLINSSDKVKIVGGKSYATLKAAIEAVEDGQTVQLLESVTLTETAGTVTASNVTLDMNGKTITYDPSYANKQDYQNLLFVKGSLTITGNGTITGPTDAKAAGYDGKVMISVDGENASLTYLNGTLTVGGNGNDGMYGVYALNGGTVVFGDATTKSGPSITAYFGAYGNNNTTSPANVTIYGGTYTSSAVVGTEDGNLASQYAHFATALYLPAYGTVTISGGTFNGYYGLSSRYYNVDQTLNISDGTFTGSEAAVFKGNVKGNFGTLTKESRTFAITGGTFSSDVNDYCATGYAAVQRNTVYKVGKVETSNVVPPTEKITEETTEVTYTMTTTVTDQTAANPEDATLKTENITSLTVKGTTASTEPEANTYTEAETVAGSGASAVGAVKLSDIKSDSLNDVVTAAVEAAGSDSASVSSIKVVVVNDGVTEESATAFTFEVHPEAIAYKTENDVTTAVGSAKITNDQLAADATFTITLDVSGKYNDDDKVNVTHRREDGSAEYLGEYKVADGKITIEGIKDFSAFDLVKLTDNTEAGATFAYNLSLKDSIDVKFYVTLEAGQTASDFTVKYQYGNGAWQTQTLTHIDETEIVVAQCAAKEMTVPIRVQVYKNSALIKDAIYTVKGYCDSILDLTDTAAGALTTQKTVEAGQNLQTLCQNVLDYGAASQTYFNYNTGSMANAKYATNADDIANTTVPVDLDVASHQLGNIVTKIGRAAKLESKVGLEFSFVNGSGLNVASVTIAPNNDPVAYTYDTDDEGRLRVYVSGVIAYNMNRAVTVTLSDDTTVTYSPLAYAQRMQNGNAKLANLCKTLYRYYDTVNKYFGS